MMSWSTVTPLCALLAIGACSGEGDMPGGGTPSPTDLAAWVGTYNAQWNGTTTFSSPPGLPPAGNREHAVMTVSAAANGQIEVRWQLTGNPQSGVVVFSVSGKAATMVANSPRNMPFSGTTSNGTVGTSSCDVCTASLEGNVLTQDQEGHNAGFTNGVSWTGTYSGSWVGIRTP
jgi:hypothetical protein